MATAGLLALPVQRIGDRILYRRRQNTFRRGLGGVPDILAHGADVSDAYIVLIGMLVALLHRQILCIRHNSLARSGAPRFLCKHFQALRRLAVGLALVVLLAFWTLTRRSPNKADYNW
jgi:hypothetical protein